MGAQNFFLDPINNAGNDKAGADELVENNFERLLNRDQNLQQRLQKSQERNDMVFPDFFARRASVVESLAPKLQKRSSISDNLGQLN